jgi:hypothetical protein
MSKNSYVEIRNHFSKISEVTVLSGSGAQGMKIGKKMFAFFTKGHIMLKLSQERVTELIDSGEGLSYDPGTGKTMKNMVIIPVSNKKSWIKYCEESLNYMEKITSK